MANTADYEIPDEQFAAYFNSKGANTEEIIQDARDIAHESEHFGGDSDVDRRPSVRQFLPEGAHERPAAKAYNDELARLREDNHRLTERLDLIQQAHGFDERAQHAHDAEEAQRREMDRLEREGPDPATDPLGFSMWGAFKERERIQREGNQAYFQNLQNWAAQHAVAYQKRDPDYNEIQNEVIRRRDAELLHQGVTNATARRQTIEREVWAHLERCRQNGIDPAASFARLGRSQYGIVGKHERAERAKAADKQRRVEASAAARHQADIDARDTDAIMQMITEGQLDRSSTFLDDVMHPSTDGDRRLHDRIQQLGLMPILWDTWEARHRQRLGV